MTTDCRPDYAVGDPPDYVPIFEPKPADIQPPYKIWDCWMAVYDNRRSRGVIGTGFFRSITQESNMNGISIEATTSNVADWIIFDDPSDPYNMSINDAEIFEYIKVFVRFYNVTNVLHYQCIQPPQILIVPDPKTSGALDLVDSFVVQGNYVATFDEIYAFHVIQAEANTGLYFFDYALYDPTYNITRIYVKNPLPTAVLPNRHEAITNNLVPIEYAISAVRVEGIYQQFVLQGNLTQVFNTGMSFFVEQSTTTEVNGEYIINAVSYNSTLDETYISIKDYRDIPRSVRSSSYPHGVITKIHTIDSYVIDGGVYVPSSSSSSSSSSSVSSGSTDDPITITEPPNVVIDTTNNASAAVEETLVLNLAGNFDQLRTQINGHSLVLEMPTRGYDVHDLISANDESMMSMIPTSETYLSGADSKPSPSCSYIPYFRSGPERTFIIRRTSENNDGSLIIPAQGEPEQWDGVSWIPYNPNTECPIT